MLKRVILFALIVALCLAQEPIKVQVREVLVPVTVTDDKGRFVSNLDARDFRIYDEGVEQKIDYFSREHSQPVVVGFLLDMSNNMKIHWKTYQDAVIELIQALLPGDNDRFDLTGDLVLVLGREGAGLHDLVKRTCDHLLRIPMAGGVSSLNVSAAGAVVLYEAFRQRRLRSAQNPVQEAAPRGRARKKQKGLGS